MESHPTEFMKNQYFVCLVITLTYKAPGCVRSVEALYTPLYMTDMWFLFPDHS